MSKFEFKKATKEQARLRMAIHGPSGSGKTFTALNIAQHLGKIGLGDTEMKSASKYGDKFDFKTCQFEDDYHPDRLVEFLHEAPKEGFDILIIDSLTHFWNGPGGFLELVDAEVKKGIAKGQKGDSFNAWKTVDPIYKRLVHAIHACQSHVIVTLRAKTEYAKEQGSNGRTTVRKIGMAPEMRDNFQYEMDVEGMLSIDHDLVIGKTRCDALDGKVFAKPGKEVADILNGWLSSGVPMREPEASPAPANDIVGDLVARFESASSPEEVEAVKTDANKVRDRLGTGAATVRDAMNAAKERFAA